MEATGHPTVRKQRNKWVVRVDGIDTETGKHRPRQLGMYASERSACRSRAARSHSSRRVRGYWSVRRYVLEDFRH